MPGLETLLGRRIVASPVVLDAAEWSEGSLVLRLAPDDVFVIGDGEIRLADEHAIVVAEAGFRAAWLSSEELNGRVAPHIEWPIPSTRPVFLQGLIAGVPAKLWLTDGRSLLLCADAYAHELAGRLG